MIERRFQGHDGAPLFRRAWPAEGGPRGALINVHGLGDHSGLYAAVAEHLTPLGFAVHAPDLRGNGRSPGVRGHVGAWRDYREDLGRFVDLIRHEEPGLPVFLLGHSLGGLIVLDYALHRPDGLRGVITAAAPLGTLAVPAPLLLLGRAMSRVWPSFSLETGMDLSGLARDPAVAAEVLADPLFHRRASARLSTEVAATIARVQHGAPHFPLPVLLLHGAADRMVPPDGSRRFAARVGHPDRCLIEYAGAYHALFADTGREQVFADFERWIVARL
ncbi:MAG: alpha/beta hydrolase [Gemmatimonadales bacterium]|nr:alpha/beta hydrolase [Gemmatimonadales bacterium]